MVGQPDEYQSVLKTVTQWPAEKRATSAHVLIDSLNREASSRRKKPTAEQFIGLVKGDGPPPTDEQVRQWMHEHRMRKYG